MNIIVIAQNEDERRSLMHQDRSICRPHTMSLSKMRRSTETMNFHADFHVIDLRKFITTEWFIYSTLPQWLQYMTSWNHIWNCWRSASVWSTFHCQPPILDENGSCKNKLSHAMHSIQERHIQSCEILSKSAEKHWTSPLRPYHKDWMRDTACVKLINQTPQQTNETLCGRQYKDGHYYIASLNRCLKMGENAQNQCVTSIFLPGSSMHTPHIKYLIFGKNEF